MYLMEYETLKFEKEEGGIAVVTINRPDRLNAINDQFWTDFTKAHHEILKDKDINAWILTGAPRPDGRPCFSAGADLKDDAKGKRRYDYPEYRGPLFIEEDDMFPRNTPAGRLWAKRPRLPAPIFFELVWSPKISIAAIDGVAIAFGLELALVCDIILVSETAQIFDTHVKNLGFGIGGGSVTTSMARKVGYSKALELLLTADKIDGKEALRIGFANRCYPPSQLIPEAKVMAKKIAAMRPGAISLTKLSCRSVSEMGYNAAWNYGEELLHWGELDPEWAGLQRMTQQWEKRDR
jgi:enoyl-CoA hydratase/carnithine racemase